MKNTFKRTVLLFLAFKKFQNLAVSVCPSVCPSLHPFFRTEQLGSHLPQFHDIWHLNIFRKYIKKIQVSLKSDDTNGHRYVKDPYTSFDVEYIHGFVMLGGL